MHAVIKIHKSLVNSIVGKLDSIEVDAYATSVRMDGNTIHIDLPFSKLCFDVSVNEYRMALRNGSIKTLNRSYEAIIVTYDHFGDLLIGELVYKGHDFGFELTLPEYEVKTQMKREEAKELIRMGKLYAKSSKDTAVIMTLLG